MAIAFRARTVDDPKAQLNFEQLSQLIFPITRGVATVNFATSQIGTTVTVPHGLGVTPAAIMVTLTGAGSGFATELTFTTSAIDSSTFNLDCYSSVALTQNISAAWVAVA